MKICFVTTSFIRGPRDYYSRFVFEQARSILATDPGAEVTVVAPHAAGLARRETIEGIRIERFRYFWPASLQQLAYRNEGLFSTLRSSLVAQLNLPSFLGGMFSSLLRNSAGADVIHAQWLPTAMVACLVGRLRRIPVVASIRGADINTLSKSGIGRRLACSLVGRVDHVITVSDEFQRRLAEAGCKTPVDAVYNGIDELQFQPRSRSQLKRELGLPDSERHILYIGGLIPRKRVDTLLLAFETIVRRRNNIRLCIVGEGPDEAELKRLAHELGITGRVSFIGPVPRDQTHRWLGAAEMLVLPSESEGRPNVVLEALASQRPVIATRVNGAVELIEHGQNGLLFEPGDVHELTALIDGLLADQCWANTLAIAGRKSIQDRGLTWTAHGEKLRQIYQEVIGKHQRRQATTRIVRPASTFEASQRAVK